MRTRFCRLRICFRWTRPRRLPPDIRKTSVVYLADLLPTRMFSIPGLLLHSPRKSRPAGPQILSCTQRPSRWIFARRDTILFVPGSSPPPCAPRPWRPLCLGIIPRCRGGFLTPTARKCRSLRAMLLSRTMCSISTVRMRYATGRLRPAWALIPPMTKAR